MTDETSDDGAESRFADAGIDRRTFVKLSAATGAALALPGNAAANVSGDAYTAEYQYVQNHTPEGHAVPTLVEFEEGADPTALETVDENAVTLADPPAAYGRLTATEARTAADLPDASTFQFAPGSNPFWRIGEYPLGIFPEPTKSVDYIGFEQLKDGLAEIEARANDETFDQYENRIRVRNVGASPGHLNDATDRPDPKGLYVAEVTNFDSEASFEEKEKVFFSCSLHGPERAGAEAGARVVENVVRSSEPDIQGSEAKVEPLLDDMVIIFGFVNPDGWVAKNPQYESSWQFDIPGVKGLPLYERGNAGVYDTNRQYPSVGYIIPPPGHYPAEPAEGTDAPDYVDERVPDARDLIEHFRGYENLNYGADLHGGPIFNEFVLGLISQHQFNTRDLHELYEMCLNIDDTLEEALEVWTTLGDAKLRTVGEQNVDPGVLFGVTPEEAFDYGTIYDTIDYTVSGAFLDWMAHPEITDDEGNVVGGGLGMTTLDFEMSFSWAVNGNIYNPELVRQEVIGYRTAIRTISEFGFRNTNTPSEGSSDEFNVTTETGGESVAVVTTGETDALRRQDEDLIFSTFQSLKELNYSGVIGPGAAGSTTTTHTFTAPDGAERVEATLSWDNVQDLDFFLENSDGQRIAGSANFGGPEAIRTSIEGGAEYTFVVETFASAAARYEIEGDAGEFADSREDDGSTETNGTVVENEVAANGVATTTYTVDQDLHSLSIHPHAPRVFFDVELVSPSGETVYTFEGVTEERAGGKCCGLPEWVVTDPEPGVWTLKVTNNEPEAKPFEIQFGTLATTGDDGVRTPDPQLAVGYEQRPYDVTPFTFFDDYAEYIDEGTIEEVSVDEIAKQGAAALDGYDHAVVIHDYLPGLHRASDGRSDADYTGALDQFVDDGGNLVLTDTGGYLLPQLDNQLVDGSAIALEDDISRIFDDVAQFQEKNLDHPLFGTAGDVRPIQDQLWKVAPLGYAVSGEAQMDVVAEDPFTAAARNRDAVPSVAGRAGGAVAAGSVTPSTDEGTGIHVISSLLPPAKQSNLHPFGLLNYTATFLGYVMLTSALGFEQVRKLDDGETKRRFGRGDQWTVEDDGGGGGDGSEESLSADGSRGDTNNPYTAGDTHTVRITITELSKAATVTDSLPGENWKWVGGDGTQKGATVDFGEIGSIDPAEDDPEELKYFVEVPAETGQSDIGPAEATAGDTTVTIGEPNTLTTVGVDPNGGSTTDSGTDSTLTGTRGFTDD